MDPEHLMSRYFCNLLTDEEFCELQSWLEESPVHVDRFTDVAMVQQALQDLCYGDGVQENLRHGQLDVNVFSDSNSDTAVWQSLLHIERDSPAAEPPKTTPEPVASVAVKTKPKTTICKFWPMTALVTSLAAMVLVVFGVIDYFLAHRVVATLGESVHAKWAAPVTGSELKRGWMTLDEGVAELTLKKGTRVLIQAPCEFNLQSVNSLELAGGAITAFVPEGAQGFRISTPLSEIVDYGTEFGVSVGRSTAFEVHVFQGEVGLDAMHTPGSQDLHAGQYAWANASGSLQTESLENRRKLFLRQLPDNREWAIPGKCLNLADVVGGGNGFGTGQDASLWEIQDRSPSGKGIQTGWPINCVKLEPGQAITIDGVIAPMEYMGAQSVIINAQTATEMDPYQPAFRHAMFQDSSIDRWQSTSLDDFSGTYYVMWDDSYLYVAVHCEDDSYQWQENRPTDIRADVLQFTIVETLFAQHPHSVCIPTIAPRDVNGLAFARSDFDGIPYMQHDIFKDPCHPAMYAGSVDDATQNWTVEVKIPWVTLQNAFRDSGLSKKDRGVFPPQVGEQIGFSIIAVDYDETNGGTQHQVQASTHPGAWPWNRVDNQIQEPLTFTERLDTFNTIERLPYVDGYFLVDSSLGPCRISSQGHIFTDCPDTNISMATEIRSGWPQAETLSDHYLLSDHEGHSQTTSLSVQGNQGITFDLQAIQEDLTGVTISEFNAQFRVVNATSSGLVGMDLWVLVDGRTVFSKQGIRSGEQMDLSIELEPSARFLTLVSAQDRGGGGAGNHWGVFFNPMLKLRKGQ